MAKINVSGKVVRIRIVPPSGDRKQQVNLQIQDGLMFSCYVGMEHDLAQCLPGDLVQVEGNLAVNKGFCNILNPVLLATGHEVWGE